MLREKVVRGGVEPPTFRFSGFVCGLPVVSLPEQGLVGLLWAPARYGLAPRTLSQAREAEAEVLANWHLWSTESARAASSSRASSRYGGEQVSGVCTPR